MKLTKTKAVAQRWVKCTADTLTPEKKQALHGVDGVLFLNVDHPIEMACTFSFENGILYACQNIARGVECSSKWGFIYSWRLSNEEIKYSTRPMNKIVNVVSKRLFQMLTSAETIKGCRIELFFNRVIKEGENVEFLSHELLNGHHFDLRKGEISYYPNNIKLETNSSGYWIREGRQVFKVGKFIKMLLDTEAATILFDGRELTSDEQIALQLDKLTTTFMEVKSGLVKSSAFQDCVKVCDDPTGIYLIETYEGSGSLASSCMRPESDHGCREGADWYSMIGTKIAYIINPTTNKLFARALLWENCYFVKKISVGFETPELVGPPITILDRIYGDEAAIALMKEWAKEQGYYHKAEQNSRSRQLISPVGEHIDRPFIWNKGITTLTEYSPYMDTFCYLSRDKKLLGSKGAFSTDSSYLLDITCSSGGAFDNVVPCPNCGGFIFSHELRELKSRKDACILCSVEERDDSGNSGFHILRTEALEFFNTEGRRVVIRNTEVQNRRIVAARISSMGLINVEVVSMSSEPFASVTAELIEEEV